MTTLHIDSINLKNLHDRPLDNRKCPYCDRVYRYPSILKHHLRLKNVCSERANQVSNRASQVSDFILTRLTI